MNTTKPTSGLSPITNVPNVSTTPPASASDRMDLVVETLRPKRNNVKSNKREGKIENCNASLVFIDTKITIRASVMLHKINILNSHQGNEIINIMMINITPRRTDKSHAFIHFSP